MPLYKTCAACLPAAGTAQTALVGLVSAGFLLDGVELQDQAAGGFALASFFDVDSR
jgi:hypothetical protein